MCQNCLDIKEDVSKLQKDSTQSAKRNVSPTSNASATHVWVVLWKAARAVEENAMTSVAGLGLGLSDFAVLEVLLHKGPQPVNVRSAGTKKAGSQNASSRRPASSARSTDGQG
jgi:hypothetical protein